MKGFQYDAQGPYVELYTGERLAYHLLWHRWLEPGEVVDGSAWVLSPEVTVLSEDYTDTSSSVLITSAVPGVYRAKNTVTSGVLTPIREFRVIVSAPKI